MLLVMLLVMLLSYAAKWLCFHGGFAWLGVCCSGCRLAGATVLVVSDTPSAVMHTVVELRVHMHAGNPYGSVAGSGSFLRSVHPWVFSLSCTPLADSCAQVQ